MNEIKCPNCGEVFIVDETSYSAILKQVKDREFDREIKNRIELELNKSSKRYDEELNKERSKNARLTERLESFDREKEAQIEAHLSRSEKEHRDEIKNKDIEIERLRSQIESQQREKQMDIDLALSKKNEEIAQLQEKLRSNEKIIEKDNQS